MQKKLSQGSVPQLDGPTGRPADSFMGFPILSICLKQILKAVISTSQTRTKIKWLFSFISRKHVRSISLNSGDTSLDLVQACNLTFFDPELPPAEKERMMDRVT